MSEDQVQETKFSRADSIRWLAELDAAVTRYQASVEECCQAIKELKANFNKL